MFQCDICKEFYKTKYYVTLEKEASESKKYTVCSKCYKGIKAYVLRFKLW